MKEIATFLLRLPPSLKRDVTRIAEENKRSLTREIEHALAKYVVAHAKEPQ